MRQLIQNRVPDTSLDYCLSLWNIHPFSFKISRKRKTKLGDYRYDPATDLHTITINENLNKYLFLTTLIHEIAHLKVRLTYRKRVSPHGKEWKSSFQELMIPLVNESVYPQDILSPLIDYMSNPAASSQSFIPLSMAFRKYDNPINKKLILTEVSIGQLFSIDGMTFKKLKERRTRVLCREVKSGRNYLVSKVAEIDI